MLLTLHAGIRTSSPTYRPVRAHRRADGDVQLNMPHNVSRRLVGPAVDTNMTPVCSPTMGSSANETPPNSRPPKCTGNWH